MSYECLFALWLNGDRVDARRSAVVVDAMLAAAKGYLTFEQMAARSDDEDEAAAKFSQEMADIKAREEFSRRH